MNEDCKDKELRNERGLIQFEDALKDFLEPSSTQENLNWRN